MITIEAVRDGDVIKPQKQIPQSAVAVEFDGEKFIIYEAGDKLPDTAEG